VRPKVLYFIQPRRERFWICDQKYCILFSRAAKNCGTVNKSTAFCSAVHRKNYELRTKAFFLCSAAQRNFGIATKSTVVCSAASEIFWNCEQNHCILFSRAAKILEFTNKPNSNCLHFVLPGSHNFRNLPTEATQINCILFCCADKILEFTNKCSSN
jgi:hypothetical protein